MEYLEYKQLETALRYIEEPALGEKRTDDNYNRLLAAFQIKGRPIGREKNMYGFYYSYGNGCTENQMNMIRGILLSARYNYNKFENELHSEGPLYEDDENTVRYKGNTLENLERIRNIAAIKIKNSYDIVKKLNIVMENSNIINEGIEKLAEYRLIKKAAVKNKIFDAAMYMIEDGISLTQIVNCLEADLLDIYYLAESMNRPFRLSEKEEELIKKAKKAAAENNLRRNKNIPAVSPSAQDEGLIRMNYAYM